MDHIKAAASGGFKIGGDLPVARLGFGAMRMTGPGIWGQPTDRAEAIRTLRRLPALGVTFIDTADSYGPDVSEALIREALHPYGDIVVATKAGLTRAGPDAWAPGTVSSVGSGRGRSCRRRRSSASRPPCCHQRRSSAHERSRHGAELGARFAEPRRDF